MRHILTIDVEDWYLAHLEFFPESPASLTDPLDASVIPSVQKFLDLLDETHNTATFFVLGTVAGHFPDLVREIVARGHEVGSHGHLHRRLHHLTPEEFKNDLEQSLEVLYKAGAPRIKGYRAPSNTSQSWPDNGAETEDLISMPEQQVGCDERACTPDNKGSQGNYH